MKKRSALKMVLMSLATAILIPGTASSDVPADPWILSPVQEGQDVILTINFEEFLEIVTLIANNGSGERTVFEKKSFENEEPASTDPYCVYDEYYDAGADACAEDESDCQDCDDDGRNECSGECYTSYYFKIIDKCVEPGEIVYRLWYEDEELGCIDETVFVVEDSGDDCLYGGSDDAEDGGGDCGCAYVGNQYSGLAITLLNILIVSGAL